MGAGDSFGMHTVLLVHVWWMILQDMDRPSIVPAEAPLWQRYIVRSIWMATCGSIVALAAVSWWRAGLKIGLPRQLSRFIARFATGMPPDLRDERR